MKELLEKISSYNILNYLFPGVIFVVFLRVLTNYDFIQKDLYLGVFIYYFIGLIVSRFGSLVIEPILIKIKFLKFSAYSDFITASKKDEKIEVLSEVNNMYRTICSLLLLVLIFNLFEWICTKIVFFKDHSILFLIILLLLLFVFSYRKQTDFVRNRVEKNVEK